MQYGEKKLYCKAKYKKYNDNLVFVYFSASTENTCEIKKKVKCAPLTKNKIIYNHKKSSVENTYRIIRWVPCNHAIRCMIPFRKVMCRPYRVSAYQILKPSKHILSQGWKRRCSEPHKKPAYQILQPSEHIAIHQMEGMEKKV